MDLSIALYSDPVPFRVQVNRTSLSMLTGGVVTPKMGWVLRELATAYSDDLDSS